MKSKTKSLVINCFAGKLFTYNSSKKLTFNLAKNLEKIEEELNAKISEGKNY